MIYSAEPRCVRRPSPLRSAPPRSVSLPSALLGSGSRAVAPCSIRKGTNGVSTNGFIACFKSCFTEGPFGHSRSPTFSSQKCQGIPFSLICQIHYFCSGPSVDPNFPQPRYHVMSCGRF